MDRNVGSVDRAVRVVAGLVLVGLAVTGPKIVWGWLGLIPLVTAIVGFCPAYTLFGIGTDRRRG